MHDYHAVVSLIERITSQAADLEHIAEVRIRAGATFSPEALQQAWGMLTQNTPLEGTCLVVEAGRRARECPACAGSWVVTSDDLAGHLLVCPSCGIPSPIGRRDTGIELLDTAGTMLPPRAT
jgi:Zn finger protein HypA/HybF involved in hydrogenase expression